MYRLTLMQKFSINIHCNFNKFIHNFWKLWCYYLSWIKPNINIIKLPPSIWAVVSLSIKIPFSKKTINAAKKHNRCVVYLQWSLYLKYSLLGIKLSKAAYPSLTFSNSSLALRHAEWTETCSILLSINKISYHLTLFNTWVVMNYL